MNDAFGNLHCSEKTSGVRILIFLRLTFISLITAISWNTISSAQSVDDCMICHEDASLTGERSGREFSVYVDLEEFFSSVHGEDECISCHVGIEEIPHEERLPEVDCEVGILYPIPSKRLTA
jgi:hypothetical protein